MSQSIELEVGATKETRLFVVAVSLAGVVTTGCVMTLVLVSSFKEPDCGELPDWDAFVDPEKRQNACTGEPCKHTTCGPEPGNSTCRGMVRPYADGCRCCHACVLDLGLNDECSNNVNDHRDIRQCGLGFYCNARTCTCKKYFKAP
ncbi:uncharacterized protein LOC144135166 [Amblyomma americanum]